MKRKRTTNSDPYERFRRDGFVRWSELSEEAKTLLLTRPHPTNRPTQKDIDNDFSQFRADGSGWICGFAF